MQPFNPSDFLILVVDDISKNLQVLSSILDEFGYCTTFATNGHQALERIATAKPDLILLDMMMPGMDGLEVCDRLKSNPVNREIPVIFLTASQESEHLVKAFELGAVDYITKPFKTPELLARVRNQLELKHTQDQLKNTLKELVESRDEAIKSAQIKTQFLANMSHEIRTPMNAVLGMTELLLGTDLNPQQLDFLNTLKNSGNNLLVIINEILDYSKLESGEMSLGIEDFQLQETLEDVYKMFKSSVQEKSIQLSIEHDSKIPRVIKGDSHRLRQILVNLISNAIKFTDTGSVKINVILDRMLTPSSDLYELTENLSTKKIKLRFEVEDTGIGIKSEDQAKIFSSFFQADSSSTRTYAGTGLGLAICQQLVELMNGQIGVNSEFGKGSKFWFTVILESTTPAIHEKQSEAADSMRESLAKKNQPASLEDLKILVVEDTKINQKVILQQLKRLKCTADCVNNGQEALDLLQLNTYDIVLMDCQMPVLDGYAATEQIRERERQQNMKTVVIGLTAYAMKGDREKCLDAGMDDYLSKPVSIDNLGAMLKKWSRKILPPLI
jgi:CheY-like chemotaxis protein